MAVKKLLKILRLVDGSGQIKLTKDGKVLLKEMVNERRREKEGPV